MDWIKKLALHWIVKEVEGAEGEFAAYIRKHTTAAERAELRADLAELVKDLAD